MTSDRADQGHTNLFEARLAVCMNRLKFLDISKEAKREAMAQAMREAMGRFNQVEAGSYAPINTQEGANGRKISRWHDAILGTTTLNHKTLIFKR